MEEIRLRDEYWSPPHSADPATPCFSQADPFLLTPNRRAFDPDNTSNPHYTDKSLNSNRPSLLSKLGSEPLFEGFERPNLSRITILTVLCLSAYPLLYILTLVAKDKSLFTVRLIVAMWCSAVGFTLGFLLIRIGVQHLEAATWATVIHMSYEGNGMKLRDLARNSQNPTSFLSALLICAARLWSQDTARGSRSSYDKRPWTVFIFFFIVVAVLGPLLPFLFGRIMVIDTFIRNQYSEYREVLITGDLSPDDVARATDQLGAFQNFVTTWTLLPYGTSPPNNVEFTHGNDTVYLAQPSLSQFMPNGTGLGIFNLNQTSPIDRTGNPNNTLLLSTNGDGSPPESEVGAVLRFSQWGIRIHCEKLPNPTVNLISKSNQTFTYAFLPQDFLQGLFSSYGMAFPASLTKPDLSLLDHNDTIPADIDPSKISYLIKWYDNGVAHSFHTRTILDTGAPGWTTVETVLIRLNTGYTPSGVFPVYSNELTPDSNGVAARIGYDAAVCVERYEPWITETYNSSVGSPTTLRIITSGTSNTSVPSGKIHGDPIQDFTEYLNTTGKNPAFYVAHDNSVNQIVKDNGRDFYYVPSPTSVSFTDGAGPEGYIELSPERFAINRARVDASNVLPYLAGSGKIVAQSYPDQTLAYVTYAQWQLIGLPMLVLLLGVMGELFVPTLPLNVPRRGFGVYSWLALFHSQELQFETAHEFDRLMTLEELEKKFSDKEIKFVV